MTPDQSSRRPRSRRGQEAPRRRSVRCRNGIWPTSIRRWTRPRSSATSTAARPNASSSRRPTRAGSPTSRPAPTPAATLGEAVRRYEAIEDVLGRLISYAGLLYAGNTTDPAIAQVLRRHAGAHHRGLAASFVLHARPEPPRRRRAREGDGRSRARPLPALDRGHPQGQAVPARRPRRATVPREVGDRLFRLQPAVRRDHGGAALQGRRQVAAARADAQPACRTPTRRSARPPPRRWPRPSRRTCGCSRCHQHARQGQGDFRPLARLR